MEKLLRIGAVQEIVLKSRMTIYRAVKSGQFPRPIKIGANSVAWRESDVKNWIDTRVAA